MKNTMSVYAATDTMDDCSSIFAFDGDVMYVAFYRSGSHDVWLDDEVDMTGFLSERADASRLGGDVVLMRGEPLQSL